MDHLAFLDHLLFGSLAFLDHLLFGSFGSFAFWIILIICLFWIIWIICVYGSPSLLVISIIRIRGFPTTKQYSHCNGKVEVRIFQIVNKYTLTYTLILWIDVGIRRHYHITN